MNLQDPASIGALALAWIATLVTIATASTAAWLKLRQMAADINGVGARATTAHQTAAAALARTGGGAAAARPRPVPTWNQLDDPLPDGSLAVMRAQECGEECVAMAVMAVHGVPLSADAVRALLRGATGAALTDGAALVEALLLCNVAASTDSADRDAVQERTTSALTNRRLILLLGYWVDPSVLHWICVVAIAPGGVDVNDPWGGRRRHFSWTDLARLYGGQIVEVVRLPDP